MTTETLSPVPSQAAVAHDHAWRRAVGEPGVGVFAEYQCDICRLSWSI
jgi:hypothetical protein